DYRKLPLEIRGLFNVADPDYLSDVFENVKPLVTQRDGPDCEEPDGPVDQLGIFIERGIEVPDDGEDNDSEEPVRGGRGFHNTIHEYLGSREGRSAAGAEMNKLRKSLFNDYFWSLHLWIDGQYGRLLENLGQRFETGAQAPGDPMDTMKKSMHDRMR